MGNSEDHNIRMALFAWLENLAPAKNYVLDWKDLTQGFIYQNETIILSGAKGIWKPRQLDKYPISITSVQKSIYSDEFLDEDSLHYSYRGTDTMLADNVGLRNAMIDRVPLIYLHQIAKGRYFVAWPVYIVGDEPEKLRFTVAAESNRSLTSYNKIDEPEIEYHRKYQTREVLTRLHQSSFRERVLRAYQNHCAICMLKHPELLDAAHIIPDSLQGGEPIVTNGISLCKIHHSAYDSRILGISPNYDIEVREDILKEVDGPMLKHGIQALNKSKLILPRNKVHWPDQDRLQIRYTEFLKVG